MLLSLFLLSACVPGISSPPPSQDGTVVILFSNSADHASLQFSGAGTGTIALGALSGEPVLIDPFTYPYYDTVVFMRTTDTSGSEDIRVRRMANAEATKLLHVERRINRSEEACASWESLGDIAVTGIPGATLKGFARTERMPEVFACDR